jgi:predicted phage terminase large subunit-like protein
MKRKPVLFDVRAAQAKGRATQAQRRAERRRQADQHSTKLSEAESREADELLREAKKRLREKAPTPVQAEVSDGPADASPEQLQMIALAKLMARIQAAREDPAAFIEFAMRTPDGDPIILADFHREWLQAMKDGEMVAIEAPRGHGKTSITLGFILWLLGTNPNLRIKLLSQNDDKAKERLFEIRQNLEMNAALKMVFPHLEPDVSGEWTKTKLYVKRTAQTRDPSFQAGGILTSVTGGRIDVLICDDVCDMRNSILYPSLREDIKVKFNGEIMGTLTPDAKVIYIATPYHMADLTATIKNNPAWQFLHYQVGTPDNPFKPLWPEMWTEALLKKKRGAMGSVEYDRAYRCMALSGNTVPCKPEWIRFYTAELIGDPMQHACIQGYDLAISKKTSADYFAHVTLLYDHERHFIFIVDVTQGKYSFAEQGMEVVFNYKRWTPDKIMIESVGLGGGLESFLKEKGPPDMPILGYYPRGDKQKRFLEITPLFEDGRIFFHPKFNPQTNELVGDTGDIVTQLLEFPVGAHDDLVDALVVAISGLGDYFMSDPDPEWEQGDGTQVRMSVIG